MSIDERRDPSRGRTDWDRLRTMPEAEIEGIAAADEDNPATISDDEWIAAGTGLPPGKRSVHATFDSDVVEFFKRDGRGYQMRMNAVLRRYMEAQLAALGLEAPAAEKPES